jgi:hypothetical protein
MGAVGANNVVNATAYNASVAGGFIAPQAMPSGSPAADATKRLSIVADASAGTAYVGYRTTADTSGRSARGRLAIRTRARSGARRIRR